MNYKTILLFFASSLLSALLAIFIYRYFFESAPRIIVKETGASKYASVKEDPLSGIRQRSFFSSAPTNFIDAAAAVTPAVVNIKSFEKNGYFDPWHSEAMGSASGSGVIVSPDGFIVTNVHVIEGADKIEVTLDDKRTFPAKVIGSDPSTDLALIRIKSDELPWVEFGNSDSLRIGEWVLAIGNPFNLSSTVTAGIVSAKGRSIDILDAQDRIESFIQTDAAVNPGNSGGALVNTNGELIGINTAIMTRSGRYEGYSFAVPSSLARKVIKDLRDYGEIQRALLGVFIGEITDELANELGLPSVEGVYITRVSPGSGADDAGLKKGDVIIGINGVETETLPEMQEQIGQLRPGNSVDVSFIRGGEKQTTVVTLKSKNNSITLLSPSEQEILFELGFEARNLTSHERKETRKEGIKVISIYRGSIIEKTKMDPGFIITHINKKRINNMKEFIDHIKSKSGKTVLGGFYEDYSGEYYYTFVME